MFKHSYINRQFSEVTKGGASIFARKILTLIKLVLFTPSYFFALPILTFLYLIRPWFLVRFSCLTSSRLGHFAVDTELYLCARDLGLFTPSTAYLDLFCFEKVSNKQLAKMWKRQLNILPSWFLLPIININRFLSKFFPQFKLHHSLNYIKLSSDNDWDDLLGKSSQHLKFTKGEIAYGKECLKKLGLLNSEKFVCLDVRDQAFLNCDRPEKVWNYHSLRNVELENFILAAEELTKRGYYVFRMGKKVLKPLKSSNSKIIDYANSNLRSDFLDIFIGAHCSFYLGCSGGFSAIPHIFRKPLASICCPVLDFVKPELSQVKLVTGSNHETIFVRLACLYSKNGIGIIKHYISKQSGKKLTLKEIFSNNLTFGLRDLEYFSDKGIILQDPTPEEIKDMAIEMADLIENKWKPKEGDNELQEKVQNIFDQNINSNFFKSEVSKYMKKNFTHVGKFKGKISTQFLRKNSKWLN